ncbi:MAG: prolipoprotein diacylglyceryl transferase [Erysipelotrichaceae bacterium]
MQFFPDFKTFIQIGSFSITWYAVFVLSAAMVCYSLSVRTLKKMGYKVEMLEDFFITMLPIAFLGARLWYVAFEWERYGSDLIRIFYIWEGGLAIHGGLIAAVAYGFWFFRRKGANVLRIADAIMPNLLIAQFIGRWGNFMNQEAYGSIVSESFYNGWPTFIKDHMFIAGEYRQPTFLFEGVGNLVGFVLIAFVYKKWGRKKRGDLMFAYLTWYGLVRLYVEGLRTDSLMIGDLRIAQLISILFMVVGILGIVGVFDRLFQNTYMFKKRKPVVLFDLDGTLLDSEMLIQKSFAHTFAQHRPELTSTDELQRSFFGPSLIETFRKYAVDEAEVQAMIHTYREYNHANHDELVRLIEGAENVVKTLHEQGYDLGVVSNKNHKMVEHGLRFCGIHEYFQAIVGMDDVKTPKPNPEGLIKACHDMLRGFDDLIYVGDYTSDVLAAKNMSAFSVAFVSDEKHRAELAGAKPMRMINQLSEVLTLVQEDVEWSDNSTL